MGDIDQVHASIVADPYPGTFSIFPNAGFINGGFIEVARRLPARPIIRLECR
ncbi:hypothetical protein GR197_05440 [Rhizobium phaseoli]|uniref:Uncharacterized protein n=1 Tax=Rhizobium phaseoli TaxID=396 RepID=A0A7K3U8G4_9HYPH|nr:hypothetical protein [Rhizobium phaseoli]NEJ69982.1 hypothetical protein [Rhizobium phaseoli]